MLRCEVGHSAFAAGTVALTVTKRQAIRNVRAEVSRFTPCLGAGDAETQRLGLHEHHEDLLHVWTG